MSEDWGSHTGLLISRAMWAEFFRDYHQAFFAEAPRHRMEVIFDSCGQVTDIVDEPTDLGIDLLDLVQPGAMDLEEMARPFGGRVTVSGAVDLQRLHLSTPPQIGDAVRRTIDSLGRRFGGGFLVGPANVLTPEVPIEKLQALFAACHKDSAMPCLFPPDLPGGEWHAFAASGFSASACGVIYRDTNQVCWGIAPSSTPLPPAAARSIPRFWASAPRTTPGCWPRTSPRRGLASTNTSPAARTAAGAGKAGPPLPERSSPGSAISNSTGCAPLPDPLLGLRPGGDPRIHPRRPSAGGLRAWTCFLHGNLRTSLMPGMVFAVRLRNTFPD